MPEPLSPLRPARRPRRRPLRRPRGRARAAGATLAAGLGLALGAGLLSAPGAQAAPAGDYQLPFVCGESWTGTTRAGHSPSPLAIDWNRPDDLGKPVLASAQGVVRNAYPQPRGGYGKYVVIDHGGTDSTVYAHLDSVLVVTGQRVDTGTQIGTVGSTGNSSSAHLHQEQKTGTKVVPPTFGGAAFRFGATMVSQNCVDVPLAGNLIGSRPAELIVFRREPKATFRIHRPGAEDRVLTLGNAYSQPVIGDWDGNGVDNIGVRDPATGRFSLRYPNLTRTIAYGQPTDIGIAGDWDGDGKAEIGLYRPSTGQFFMRPATGASMMVRLGGRDSIPVTGDWNGDGVTDLGVYDRATATFRLRYQDAQGIVWSAEVVYGAPGDLPVVGDWDGNGVTDLGTWRPGTATFNQRQAERPDVRAKPSTKVRFGRARL